MTTTRQDAAGPRRGRRTLWALAVAGAMPLLVACPKKTPPAVEDAQPPPPVMDAAPVELQPIVEDASVDASDAAAKKASGPAVNPNVARLKQCCSALNSQATALGTSPEAAALKGLATQCNAMAVQVGPSGNAPELAPLRQLLKMGKGIPAICQGL